MSAQRPTTVADVMTPDPIVISADVPLTDAARLIEENEISGLPVVDADGVLIGVVSQTDLVRARATEYLWSRWPGLRVRHLMHAPALTADVATSLQEAAQIMERAHVHRLVVVAEDQLTPIGVVSTSDLVRAIVGEQTDA
jgi:CBS domain-containing protein